MADLTSAVRSALAAHLTTQLAGPLPGLEVRERWPDPAVPLPPYAVAVLVTGPPQIAFHSPRLGTVRAGGGPVQGLVPYSYGRAVVPLQLDAWARYASQRDQLANLITLAVNKPPSATLGTPGTFPTVGVYGGLVLTLPDLFGAPCDYRFGALAQPVEASDAAQAAEWRATWQGEARVVAANEETVALIQQIHLDVTLDGIAEPERTVP